MNIMCDTFKLEVISPLFSNPQGSGSVRFRVSSRHHNKKIKAYFDSANTSKLEGFLNLNNIKGLKLSHVI